MRSHKDTGNQSAMNEDREKIKEAKRETRKRARQKLKDTSDEYRKSASASICAAVKGLEEYRSASTVLAYSSLGREVSTEELIGEMLRDGRRVCLPRCTDIDENGKRRDGSPEMEARLVSRESVLGEGAYGISEPAATDDFPLVDPREIDLIILPCLACDYSCGRIGHGAGYYDRFLSYVRSDCAKVALCYEAVMEDSLPLEEHDVLMDAVVTEKRVYRWRQ